MTVTANTSQFSTTSLKLTEVQTCMLRIAVRHMAENTPHRSHDEPPGKRDYYRLAELLDPFIAARIEQ